MTAGGSGLKPDLAQASQVRELGGALTRLGNAVRFAEVQIRGLPLRPDQDEACRDGGHQAIRLPEAVGDNRSIRRHGVAHRVPEVDAERCVGCNLCSLVCPVPGCITMRSVDTGRGPLTWAQHQALASAGGGCSE